MKKCPYCGQELKEGQRVIPTTFVGDVVTAVNQFEWAHDVCVAKLGYAV